MPNTQENIYTRPDEIDLIAFLERVVRFFYVHRFIFLIGIITGILFGWLSYLRAPKQYSASMLLKTTVLSNAEEIAIITNWNDLIKRNEPAILAKELNITVEDAEKIEEIDAEDIMKLYVEKNPIGFRVMAVVTDTSLLGRLQNAIVFALENSDFIRPRIEERRATVENLIRIGKQEIAALDSTKKGVEKMMLSGNIRGGGLLADISSFHAQMVELNETVSIYETELKFLAPIKVLQGFIKYNKSDGAPLVKKVVLGALGGFIAAYLITFLASIIKKVRQRRSASL